MHGRQKRRRLSSSCAQIRSHHSKARLSGQIHGLQNTKHRWKRRRRLLHSPRILSHVSQSVLQLRARTLSRSHLQTPRSKSGSTHIRIGQGCNNGCQTKNRNKRSFRQDLSDIKEFQEIMSLFFLNKNGFEF